MLGTPRPRPTKMLLHLLLLLLLSGCVPVGEAPHLGSGTAPAGNGMEEGPGASDRRGEARGTAAHSTPAPGPRGESAPPPTRLRETPSAPGREAACAPSAGQALVDAVNQVRRQAGLPPLLVDRRLAEAARAHSVDMARRDRIGHDGSDGLQVQHRVEARGYDWLVIAENVAAGQPTVTDVMGSWLESPGHRRNILNPAARHMGAASATASGGRVYWTQVFGNTEVPTAPPGGCHP